MKSPWQIHIKSLPQARSGVIKKFQFWINVVVQNKRFE